MRRAATFFALAALGVALLLPAAPGGAQPTSTTLFIYVRTRNDRGRAFCAVWRGARGFPTQREHAAGEGLDREIEDRTALIRIRDLGPGNYAAACFHDENANNDLDRFMGIPSEGTGFSNNARPWFGPPSYRAARFAMPPRERAFAITVPINYTY